MYHKQQWPDDNQLSKYGSGDFSGDFQFYLASRQTEKADDSGNTHIVSLLQEEGIQFWLNEIEVNNLLCTTPSAGTSVAEEVLVMDKEDLCAVAEMVKAIYDASVGTTSVDDIAAMQWASTNFYGTSLRNGSSGISCPSGASTADIEP